MIDLVLSAALAARLLEAAPCDVPYGAEAILDDAGSRVIFLGETHGFRESPEFTRSMICAALERGESVVLGLEQSASEQPRLERYLASDGSEEAVSSLIEGSSFWDGQDGRASHAMLALVEWARETVEAGADLRLVALDFDPEADRDIDDFAAFPDRRDRAMLRRIRQTHAGGRYFVLVGNVHSRLTPLEYDGRRLETIGSLGDGADEFVSVRMVPGAGTAWNCSGPSADEYSCGLNERSGIGIAGAPRLMGAAEVSEFGLPDAFGSAYTHYVFLGDVNASMPVVSADPEN